MTPRPLSGLYAARLRRQIARDPRPGHVGLIMDGNRRWARQAGFTSAGDGHEHGARKVRDVLRWCEAAGIPSVTAYVCSADNLVRRGDAEIGFLMRLIERVVFDELAGPGARWRVHLAGWTPPGSPTRS